MKKYTTVEDVTGVTARGLSKCLDECAKVARSDDTFEERYADLETIAWELRQLAGKTTRNVKQLGEDFLAYEAERYKKEQPEGYGRPEEYTYEEFCEDMKDFIPDPDNFVLTNPDGSVLTLKDCFKRA